MPKIGDYTLHTIETGLFGLDGGAMFGIVPKPLWEKKIRPDEKNRIPLQMRCLLMASSDRLILIDTGLGDKYDDKFAGIFSVDHEHSTLQQSLNQAGFSPSDITDVIITHLHFDHCGGATTKEGQLVFPNAIHHVQDSHWRWAQKPNVRERNSFLQENLAPLEASGQLAFVSGQQELYPGVEVFPVYGHTEAMQLVKISGPEHTLIYAADLIPTHAHVPLAWNMGYDLKPLHTIEEKDTVLKDGVEKGWHFFLEHDPVVEIMSLEKSDRGIAATHFRPLTDL